MVRVKQENKKKERRRADLQILCRNHFRQPVLRLVGYKKNFLDGNGSRNVNRLP